jgi:hypothetical protein
LPDTRVLYNVEKTTTLVSPPTDVAIVTVLNSRSIAQPITVPPNRRPAGLRSLPAADGLPPTVSDAS